MVTATGITTQNYQDKKTHLHTPTNQLAVRHWSDRELDNSLPGRFTEYSMGKSIRGT